MEVTKSALQTANKLLKSSGKTQYVGYSDLLKGFFIDEDKKQVETVCAGSEITEVSKRVSIKRTPKAETKSTEKKEYFDGKKAEKKPVKKKAKK